MTIAQRLELRHAAGTTTLLMGHGVLEEAADELAGRCSGRASFVVTTKELLDLYPSLIDPLRASGMDPQVLTVPEGEAAKTLDVAADLWARLARKGAKRDSHLVAIGGGTVGDVAGFVAGAFARGIEWSVLPTTLLAQVDASIGGKTAVDLPEAKNAVGLFHHPSVVVAEAAWLSTLPTRELRSGLFEVVKVGILFDPHLLETVDRDLDRLLAGDAEVLAPVVAAAAALKVAVVEEDPNDQGKRAWLNLGHTLGHALETALDYRHLTHGEAVGYGTLFAVRLALSRGLGGGDARRIEALIRRLGLPDLPELDPEAVEAAMSRDKKARQSGLHWILPVGLGAGAGVTAVPAEEVDRELRDFLETPGL